MKNSLVAQRVVFLQKRKEAKVFFSKIIKDHKKSLISEEVKDFNHRPCQNCVSFAYILKRNNCLSYNYFSHHKNQISIFLDFLVDLLNNLFTP